MTIKCGTDKCPYCDGKGYYYQESSYGMELIQCSCQNKQTNRMTECVKIKCDDCKFVEDCVDYGWEGCKKFTPAPSEPLTNEEWLKSLDTEGMVDYLYEVHKGGNSVERQRWIENHKERVKMQFRGWLKQPHTNKE